jgi:N-methylhydantoinase A/oxoprolinase/acetone carboxylase beta subunit
LSVPYLDDLQAAFAEFETQHQNRYGHQLDTGLELVALRVRVAGIARLKTPITPASNAAGPAQAPPTNPNAVPQQAWQNLILGQAYAGPMIVTADHTCVWVKPGWTLEKLATGHLQLSRAEGFLRAKGFLNGG